MTKMLEINPMLCACFPVYVWFVIEPNYNNNGKYQNICNQYSLETGKVTKDQLQKEWKINNLKTKVG